MHARLAGKTAIITGASRGQGASHARRLAAEGAAILLADVLDNEGEALAQELRDSGHSARFVHLDVTDPEQWQQVLSVAEAELGPVTTLVNNAGITSRPGADRIELDEWNRITAVNQTGVLLGMKTVIPSMAAAGGGSIVNVASVWAQSGGVGRGSVGYVASKAAVIGLTRNAALDYGPQGIRVNSISPGYLNHRMTPDSDLPDEMIPRIPLRRLAEFEEISSVVAFLVSDDSSYLTGIDILIDGGLQLG